MTAPRYPASLLQPSARDVAELQAWMTTELAAGRRVVTYGLYRPDPLLRVASFPAKRPCPTP